MWPLVVVAGGEGVQEGLELGEGGRARAAGRRAISCGLLEPLHLPLRLGGSGGRSSVGRPAGAARFPRPLRPPLPPEKRVVSGRSGAAPAGSGHPASRGTRYQRRAAIGPGEPVVGEVRLPVARAPIQRTRRESRLGAIAVAGRSTWWPWERVAREVARSPTPAVARGRTSAAHL